MPDALRTFRDGRYRVVRVLGEGAQATTFEAVDAKRGMAVAVKAFRVRGAGSWKEVELAEREAKVLAQLSHPRLPCYVEHFEEGGELFLVTEKIEGESLASLRARGVTFSEADVIGLLRDASSALGYLHGLAPPIVHRDIKPSNVIRRPDGSFAFIDFGAVRDRMKPEGGSTVVGTFGYMAPEQFQGRAMPASDVYAVGATALTLLTGREPEDLPHKGLAVDVAGALAGSRVSPALVRALSAMLVPDPDTRATAVADVLAGLSGGDGDGDEDDAPGRGRSWRSRREARTARLALQRQERTWEQAPRWLVLPGLVFTAMVLALTAAEVAVWVALRVVVPLVLMVLSLVFGKGLRRAAESTSAAGKVAGAAIGRARRRLRREGDAPRARVEVVDTTEGRVRVEAGDRGGEAGEEATEEDASEARGRRRR